MKSESLAIYVQAIHDFPCVPGVVLERLDRSSWQDQGFEVVKEVKTWRFANGVRIEQVIEQDDFPCDLACAQCWISYEVLGGGDSDVPVDPPKRTFDSHCRESFWLAYQMAE